MSVEFSAKISMLRKEMGVTQRKAAEELGISQALLSHYEKGIRECNLDFVKRASSYYGVSSDYLLGITESKKGMTDLYALNSIESDDTPSPKTIIRALLYLAERLTHADENEAQFFSDYFSLMIQKYEAALTDTPIKNTVLNRMCEESLLDNIKKERRNAPALTDPTAAYRTVINNAQQQIEKAAKQLLQ